MFQVGDYIVCGRNGVCKVEDITHIQNMTGADKKKLYYVLRPIGSAGGTVYSPVENQKVIMRSVISKEAADQLICEIPDIEELWISNERMREEKYKEAMKTCDYRQWIRIIKTLYLRRKKRIAEGKKITSVDERYLRMAEDSLYSELAIALDMKKGEVESYICNKIRQTGR